MQQHPEDPLGPVSNAAAYLFAEFDRLHILQSEFFLDDHTFLNRARPNPDPGQAEVRSGAQSRGIGLRPRAVEQSPDQNAQFATLMRLGLHADYLALIEKKYLASLTEIKTGRAMAEKLIAANPRYGDADSGDRRRELSAEPQARSGSLVPARRRSGNRQGPRHPEPLLDRARRALPGPHACVLLAVAALRDKNVARAKQLLQDLAHQFPDNPLYSQELSRLR